MPDKFVMALGILIFDPLLLAPLDISCELFYNAKKIILRYRFKVWLHYLKDLQISVILK